jgi:hypothetical protein
MGLSYRFGSDGPGQTGCQVLPHEEKLAQAFNPVSLTRNEHQMTFSKIFNNQRIMLTLGQLSLVFGILLSRIVGGYWLTHLLSAGSALDFLKGFLDGTSFLMILVSLVCNLRYLTLFRANKRSAE